MYRILALLAQYQLFLHPEPLCTRKKERSDQCKKLLRYIQDNYDSKIRLSDLAAILNMNPQYFCRFFKTHFHTTPISYINQYRVTQAADLLTGSSLSILKLLCIPDLKAPAILPAFSAGLLVCHRKNIEKPCPDPANFFLLNARQHKSQNFDFFQKHLPNSFSYDNILLVAEQKSRQTKQKLRLRGQAVKTSPFHGGNTGSIPVGVIWRRSQVVRQWSATPVSTGSNPVDASSFPETDSFRDFFFQNYFKKLPVLFASAAF